jgi:hypothetical protein
MSFTEQKKKYGKMSHAAGLSTFDRVYLEDSKGLDEEVVVELLVDEIRKAACKFKFKEPLGAEFAEARDHALNCLEMGDPPPRKVHHWVSDCMKCVDCILLVYLRDILQRAVKSQGRWPKERDVYDAYEAIDDEELKRVGARCNAVYQTRSNPLEHHQVVTQDGKREIRRLSARRLIDTYEFVRGFIREGMDIMVPRYRDAFPSQCQE